VNDGFAADEDDMAATMMDPDLARHYQTWISFTHLIRNAIILVVIILAGMAYFLT
jgi:hypothetical protein